MLTTQEIALHDHILEVEALRLERDNALKRAVIAEKMLERNGVMLTTEQIMNAWVWSGSGVNVWFDKDRFARAIEAECAKQWGITLKEKFNDS